MGFSKKKAKNKAKADSRIGSKAKAKFKQKKQIESRELVKESKRKATALLSSKESKNVRDSVDDLFASFGDDDEDHEMDNLVKGAAGADSDSESSAGGFQDIGEEGGFDLQEEDLEELDDDNAAALHEEELKTIKQKDPEFYRFLVEEDKALLNFRADEMRVKAPPGFEEEEEEQEDFAAVQAAGGEVDAGPAPRLLTMERFKQLEDSAKSSFTSCKAALNAFHTAVRSIGGDPQAKGADEEQEPEDGDEVAKLERQKQREKQRKKDTKERQRSSAAKKRTLQRSLLRIDSEETFSEVLEWSVSNMLGLLRHHGGELETGKKRRKEKR